VRLIRETANHIGSEQLGERIPVARCATRSPNSRSSSNQSSIGWIGRSTIRRFTAEASHDAEDTAVPHPAAAEKLLLHGKLEAADEESVHVQLEEISRLSQIIEELLFLSRAPRRATSSCIVATHEPGSSIAELRPGRTSALEHRRLWSCPDAPRPGHRAGEPRWLRRVLLICSPMR